jgi:hypothetical protein
MVEFLFETPILIDDIATRLPILQPSWSGVNADRGVACFDCFVSLSSWREWENGKMVTLYASNIPASSSVEYVPGCVL